MFLITDTSWIKCGKPASGQHSWSYTTYTVVEIPGATCHHHNSLWEPRDLKKSSHKLTFSIWTQDATKSEHQRSPRADGSMATNHAPCETRQNVMTQNHWRGYPQVCHNPTGWNYYHMWQENALQKWTASLPVRRWSAVEVFWICGFRSNRWIYYPFQAPSNGKVDHTLLSTEPPRTLRTVRTLIIR